MTEAKLKTKPTAQEKTRARQTGATVNTSRRAESGGRH